VTSLSVARDVRVTDDTLSVDLSDGRTIAAPIAWFPRLAHASRKEQRNWRLIGAGTGIHWNDIDEDISVENLLAGRPSGESQASLKRWLSARSARRPNRRRFAAPPEPNDYRRSRASVAEKGKAKNAGLD